MSSLNKFGITEAQMLALANQHAIQYRFAHDSMADLLSYSQALLALAAPVADAAPSGEREKFEDWVRHEYNTDPRIAFHLKLAEGSAAWSAWQARAAIAHQPPKEALTDAEIAEKWKASCEYGGDTTQDLIRHFAKSVEDAAAPNKQLVAALTDEQVSKVARYLSDFSSAQCGVDKDDAWKIYGDDEITTVRAALASAGVPLKGE